MIGPGTTMALSQRLNLDDFMMLPERKPALEFFDGRVTQKVSPKMPHSTLQTALAVRIETFSVPRKLARAFTELRWSFAGASVVPDVSVYVWDRVPSDPDGYVPADAFEPPDIAFEIASPGQSIKELLDRCRWYVANGIRVSVLILPGSRVVRLFRANLETGPLRGADRIDLDDVLPGFELTVDGLFAALRAR